MCAAPGSKTSQILEIVSSPTDPHDLEPRGCVVANDSDAKRAFMLVHQLRRINSPAVLVTSCNAQSFPLLKGISSSSSEHGAEEEEEGMFDRVLCDVPCSGDGTTRKNPGVWKHWSALGSLALHPLQLSIALNGARLTKVGACEQCVCGLLSLSLSFFCIIIFSPILTCLYILSPTTTTTNTTTTTGGNKIRRVHLLLNMCHESSGE
jgi:hypothetical protein